MDDHIHQNDAGRRSTLGDFNLRLAAQNQDRVIVFVGEEYGIYYTGEFAMLLGRRVKRPSPKGAATVEERMARLEPTTEGVFTPRRADAAGTKEASSPSGESRPELGTEAGRSPPRAAGHPTGRLGPLPRLRRRPNSSPQPAISTSMDTARCSRALPHTYASSSMMPRTFEASSTAPHSWADARAMS